MKNNMRESNEIANHINKFIRVYCPSSKTSSEHTIKSYRLALTLYMDFLEEKKKITINQLSYDCFKAKTIDEWLIWLMNEKNCKPQSANVRFSSIKAFQRYLSIQDITLSLNYSQHNPLIGNNPMISMVYQVSYSHPKSESPKT